MFDMDSLIVLQIDLLLTDTTNKRSAILSIEEQTTQRNHFASKICGDMIYLLSGQDIVGHNAEHLDQPREEHRGENPTFPVQFFLRMVQRTVHTGRFTQIPKQTHAVPLQW